MQQNLSGVVRKAVSQIMNQLGTRARFAWAPFYVPVAFLWVKRGKKQKS